MFVHGIPFRYVPHHYPILTASHISQSRSHDQLKDAQHLIDQFGFEPVHFLRVQSHYSLRHCFEACFQYGDTLFVFNSLPFPRIQLSPHEWGVYQVDLRDAFFVASCLPYAESWLQMHMPQLPFFFLRGCSKRS